MLYVIIKYILGPFVYLALRPRIYGRKNLRVEGKAILVSNHISMIDPVMLAIISPRFVHFMAKKELFRSWIGRLVFKSMLAFPVNRHTPDLASIKMALHVLDKGEVFGIFPEGKRSVTGKIDELEKGASFLSLRSGAPMIPMFIDPASYERRRFRAIIGEPISTEGLDAAGGRNEMNDEYTRRIAEAFERLRHELEEKP